MIEATNSDAAQNDLLSADIALAMQRPLWTLGFPPRLERQYEADMGFERSRSLAWRGLIGIAIYSVYVWSDWILTPDVFSSALAIRAAVMLLSLFIAAMLWRNPPLFWRESMAASVCVLVGASTILVVHLSHAELRDHQLDSGIVLIIFMVLVARVRMLPYALVASAIVAAMFIVAGAQLEDRYESPASDFLNFLVQWGLTLFAGFSLEKEVRRSYLSKLRERLRGNNLESESLHDPLTGLENRRSLNETFRMLAAEQRQVAILLADIDHFKSFNDSLGHLAGDTCLKRVAGLITAELRSGADRAVRFGGEEFVIVLPDTDRWTAVEVAERMRLAIEASAIPHPGRPLSGIVTTSFGVAAARLGDGLTASELLQAADSALYAAKAAGRNQVWPRVRKAAAVLDLGRRAESA